MKGRWSKNAERILLSNSIKDETKRETIKRARKIKIKMLITGGGVVTDYEDKREMGSCWKAYGREVGKKN